jgi:signal transduction histidine kinase
LKETHEEVVRLTALADRLLDTVALGKSECARAATDLAGLARSAVDRVRPSAEEREISLRVDAPSTGTAMVNAGTLRQALDNLLANALRFAPKGTEVVVRVEREGALWVVSVRDEGPGIPPEEREAVFEPFHRAPGPAKGTGLGLTIVREVARQHGGHAHIADVPRGTEVRLELPGA